MTSFRSAIPFRATGAATSTICFGATFRPTFVEGAELFRTDAAIAIGVDIFKGGRARAMSRTFPTARSPRAGTIEATIRSFTPSTTELGRTMSLFTTPGMVFRAVVGTVEATLRRGAITLAIAPGSKSVTGRRAIVPSPTFEVSARRTVFPVAVPFVFGLAGFFAALIGPFKEGPFGLLRIGGEGEQGGCGKQGAPQNSGLGMVIDSLGDSRNFHDRFLRQGR